MQLAVRIWVEDKLIYPSKFSVMYDVTERKSSVRAFIKNDKFVSSDYMLITPFFAVNGPVFEKDLIVVNNRYNVLRFVRFNENKGNYQAINIKNDSDVIIMNSKLSYEVAGNVYEDRELVKGTKYDILSDGKSTEQPSEIKPERPINDGKKNQQKQEKEKSDKVQKPVKKEQEQKKEPKEEPKREPKPAAPKAEVKEEPILAKKEEVKPEAEELEQKTVVQESIKETIDVPKLEEPIKETEPEKPVMEEVQESVTEEPDKPSESSGDVMLTMEENGQVAFSGILSDINEADYVADKKEEKSAVKNQAEKPAKAELHFICDCDESKGSYAFTILSRGMEETFFGEENDTDPRKIALQGLIDALSYFEGSFNVTVYIDNQYVVYPFLKGWVNKWKNSNWRKGDNEKILNFELWAKLLELSEILNIKWQYVQQPTSQMDKCKDVLNANRK